METSRWKRFARRVTERVKRKPKKDGCKMPKQNLPELTIQSQNLESTKVDLPSVEETSPGNTQAREGLSHDKSSLVS